MNLFSPPFHFMQNWAAMAGAGSGVSTYTWPTSGLVARWQMDNANVTGGTTLEESIANVDATIHGGITSAAGPSPYSTLTTARAFDGVTGTYAAIGTAPFDWSSGAFSIGMWVYILNNTTGGNVGGNRQTFFSDDRAGDDTNHARLFNNTGIGAGSFGVSVCSAGSGVAIATAAGKIPNSTWTRLLLTCSAASGSGTNVLYVNGVAESTSANAAGGAAVTGTHLIGSYDLTTGTTGGRISDLVIYSRALTSGEA